MKPQIKKLEESDIVKVIDIHISSLTDISSLLGPVYVRRLYQMVFSSPDVHESIGIFVGKKLVGVAVVSKDAHRTNKMMRSIFSMYDYSKLLLKLSPLRVLERLLFERELNSRLPNEYANIVIFLIDKKHQRQGLGKMLVSETLKIARRLGHIDLYVDTRSDNLAALNFYKRMNFEALGNLYGNTVFRFRL